MGWTGRSLLHALLESLPTTMAEAEAYFGAISSGGDAVLGHLISLALTGVVVAAGIRSGIERLSRWGLPLLFLLLLGLAISVVLVHVVNPQSFHWTMDLVLPWARLALLCAAVVAAGVVTAAWTARRAASRSAVLSVKEDW